MGLTDVQADLYLGHEYKPQPNPADHSIKVYIFQSIIYSLNCLLQIVYNISQANNKQ